VNRIYRIVFNRSLGVLQVVSELAQAPRTGAGGGVDTLSSRPRSRLLAIAVSMALAAALSPTTARACTPGATSICGASGIDGSNVNNSGSGQGGAGAAGSGAYANAGGNGGSLFSAGSNGRGAQGSGGSASSQPIVGTAGGGAGGSLATHGYGGGGAGGFGLGMGGAGGGGGGAAGQAVQDSYVLTLESITGGDGGNGGNTSGNLGAGGGGGGGGAGIYAAFGATLTTSAGTTIAGGHGGRGGNSGTTASDSSLGAGSAGGGGAGVVASYIVLDNAGTIAGGDGGGGGSTSMGWVGAGGNGGAGIVAGSGSHLANSGSIAGGSGGQVGIDPGYGNFFGPGPNPAIGALTAGHGGAGAILTGGAVLTNSGSIAGGLGGDGTQADAIDLSGGSNVLILEAGSTIAGNVVSAGGDTLAFGGDTDASFDAGSIGAQYQGFAQFMKGDSSTWTLTGPASVSGAWLVFGGGLVLNNGGGTGYTGGFNLLAGTALSVQGNTHVTGSAGGSGADGIDGGAPGIDGTDAADGTAGGVAVSGQSLSGGSFTLDSTGVIVGGAGGQGGVGGAGGDGADGGSGQLATAGAHGGAGGNGAAGGAGVAGENITLTNNGTVRGGIGGSGGIGGQAGAGGNATYAGAGDTSGLTAASGGVGGVGGKGGAGGAGVSTTGQSTITNMALIAGGYGGQGGMGGYGNKGGTVTAAGGASLPANSTAGAGGVGGIGGAGGDAGDGVTGFGFHLVNSGIVGGGLGGRGGYGGIGGDGGWNTDGTAGNGGDGARLGGAGGAGGNAVSGSHFTVDNTNSIFGGTGGYGGFGGGTIRGGSTTSGTPGAGSAGGNGGAGGVGGAAVSGDAFVLNNSGAVYGGMGGQGGWGAGGGAGGRSINGTGGPGGIGGNGAIGGAGAAAVTGTGFALTNSSTGNIVGGWGGYGGSGYYGGIGGTFSQTQGVTGISGNGALGGAGAAGVSGSGFTVDNAGAITGGLGGQGGQGGWTISTSGVNGNGGNGGAGGTGVSGANFVLTNTGTITGGAGGAAGLGGDTSMNGGTPGVAGTAGAGGAGVVATGGATITNAGTIAGGLGAGGVVANAVELSGGGNTLVTTAGAIFTGNIVSTSGSTNGGDRFTLGGDTDGTFNLGSLGALGSGAAIQGFGQLGKSGSSTWTLTGSTTQAWTISGGSLVGDTGNIVGNVTFAPAGGSAGVVFAQSSDGIYAGTISGAGTLGKSGSGTLILNGSNTYTGATTVQAGTLEVGDDTHAAASIRSDVAVQAGATLRGHGSITGNVISDGTVWPGGSIGVLTINGNYTQHAGATLQVDVTPTQASQLVVNGTAALAGGLNLIYAPGTYQNTAYTLLKAQALGGQFATTTSTGSVPTSLDPRLQYSATGVQLLLGSPAASSLIAPRDGALYANLLRSANLAGQQSLATVLDATLRPAETRCDDSGTAHANTVASSCNSGVWIQYSGGSSSLSGAPGLNSTLFGLQGGVDHALGDTVHLGAEAGYRRINGNDRAGGNGRVDSLHGSVYAYADVGPLVFSGLLGAGHDSYEVYRQTGIGRAVANPDGDTASAALQAAWPMAAAQWQVTPMLGALYQHQTLDGFGESVASSHPLASAFAVQGQRSTYTTLQPYARISFARTFVAQGVVYLPQFDIGYRYDTRGDRATVRVASQDGSMFAMPAADTGRGVATVGARITAKAGASWSLYLDYRGQFASHLDDNALSVGFVKRF